MSPCDEKIACAGSSVASEKVSMLTGKKSAEKQKIVQRKIGSAIFQTETRRLHAFRCGLAGRWAGGRAAARRTVVRPAAHDVQRDRALGELGRDPADALITLL
jgi:hypothetical protein